MVGKAIKQYIDDHGIKRSFIIEKTGISGPKLTAIFKGERKLETSEYFAICDALGVDIGEFKDAVK